jgi:hypothetical protein
MAYGDPAPQQQRQQQQPQQGQQPQIADQGYYDDPYGYYPGDMWAGKPSQDHALQVREAVYGANLPEEEDFDSWFQLFRILLDMIKRVPSYDQSIYAELNRDLEDIIDRANSQGRKQIVRSKIQKFYFKISSLVPKGDTPVQGVTGITAMITNQSKSTQEIRMPQQNKQPGFWPWSR